MTSFSELEGLSKSVSNAKLNRGNPFPILRGSIASSKDFSLTQNHLAMSVAQGHMSTRNHHGGLLGNNKHDSKDNMASLMSEGGMSSSMYDLPNNSLFFQQLSDDAGLPEHFDCEKVLFQEKEFCQLCVVEFNVRNRRHHCRMCGKSVCQKCSMNKRYLSKQDKKNVHRICDFCDTKLSNHKLEQNQTSIIKAQLDQIELFNETILQTDDKKLQMKCDYNEKKEQLKELIAKVWEKKQAQEEKTSVLRDELERLNNQRNNLFSQISNDERILNEREEDKNKLIVKKSLRLTDLADKEKTLHGKETLNSELKEQLESLKKRFNKHSDEEEETKTPQEPPSEPPKKLKSAPKDPEQQRLERMRLDKMRGYQESIAQHRIDEVMSESNGSFISIDQRKGTSKRYTDPRSSNFQASVVEEENEEESENSKTWKYSPNEISGISREEKKVTKSMSSENEGKSVPSIKRKHNSREKKRKGK